MPVALYAFRTNVEPWSHPTLAHLDDCLSSCGVRLLTLPWDTLQLCSDGEHFTRRGAVDFEAKLCDALRHALPGTQGEHTLHILTDSTVGHHDVDSKGTWTGNASNSLQRKLMSELQWKKIRVDAVCGSGFAAMAHKNMHFYPRVKQCNANDSDVIVFMGGWNDRDTHKGTLQQAIIGCVKASQRTCSQTR